MFKKKHNSECDILNNGIFKKLSNNLSQNISNRNCYYLNLLCNKDCYCQIDNEKNIKRTCFNEQVYNHEINIYLTLLKYKADICTMISTERNKDIIYITHNLISLRTFLINNKSHTSLIINETFAFINKFKQYKFVHGNLHIDNIYINIKNGYTFHVIDLCNSYINHSSIEYNYNTKCDNSSNYSNSSNENDNNSKDCFNYKRESFVNTFIFYSENDQKNNTNIYHYDFISLFISLKLFFEKNNPKYMSYIQSIVCNYITRHKFNEIMKFLHLENINDIKEKYYSI